MKSVLFNILIYGIDFSSLLSNTGISSLTQTHNLATFNIRYANQNDVGNLWQDRLPHVIGQIQFHQIELFGIQEGLQNQVSQLSEGLNYKYIRVGRDDGTEIGEYAAILYDSKKFDLLDGRTFWLSPTPEVPSKGWDASLNRICTWGKFEDKEEVKFFVFNIHYDHIGQKAREESSKLVVSQIEKFDTENLPVILMGDFNVNPNNPAYTTIFSNTGWQDARLVSKTPSYGSAGTFTGFDWEKIPDGIIDHIS
ncbi:endonuclease/exonuclease/phosphatase family protein [Algoriphagus sp. SE2]|uniref:endonuclease/exonuclease/phosphatase family protein n=1 Tax=Algoriphagus sp. SE2 TaxID=3141536 RepID=UPI0031CCEDD0